MYALYKEKLERVTALLERLRVELEKVRKEREHVFSENRCFGALKNQKNRNNLWRSKKIIELNKAGKPASN